MSLEFNIGKIIDSDLLKTTNPYLKDELISIRNYVTRIELEQKERKKEMMLGILSAWLAHYKQMLELYKNYRTEK